MKIMFYSKQIQIQIQQLVSITKLGSQLLIIGPLGSTFLNFPKNVLFEQTVQGCRFFGFPELKNLILTHYKLLMNLVKGVCLGFSEILLINGVGWRIALCGKVLTFSLGFSHSIIYTLKQNVEVIIYDKQCFKIFGLDSQVVQQAVADLCKLRPFNIYKGKGIYKQSRTFNLKESSKSKA